MCELNWVAIDASCDQGNWRHRDALVHDRDSELSLDTLAHLYQTRRLRSDPVIDGIAGGRHRRASASEQGNTHGHRTNIETVFLNHLDRVNDLGILKRKRHDGRLFLR